MADVQPTISHVNGFKVAGVHCGLKKDGNLDFALIVSETPCSAAGVFTTNQVKAAPVLVDQERLKQHAHHIRAVAINSGCANACTGQQGMDNAQQTARWVAEAIGCDENQVLVMSTGVIGTQLPMDTIKRGVELAVDSLGDNWEAAARAIMTTDTRPKMASLTIDENAQRYQVAGIAKGAGMIAPNMATMLGMIVTDVTISPDRAQPILEGMNDGSFNCIVVDGDMSTNDTVLFLANNTSPVIVQRRPVLVQPNEEFEYAILQVCQKLSKDIVRDAEGATKFVTIMVDGTDGDLARKIANTIATSPLVKTAFYGADANWGRIIAAAGRADVPIELEKMSLWIGSGEDAWPNMLKLFESGVPTEYDEAEAKAIMSQPEFTVHLRCSPIFNQGDCATVWTCDLSHDYVSINADYRS